MSAPPQCAAQASRPSTPISDDRRWIRLSDLNWWVVLLLYTLGALISAGTVYTSELAEHRHLPYVYPLVTELTGYYTQMALLPLIVLAFGRFPIRWANWFWTVPLLLVISLGLGVTHTGMMYASRRVLCPVLGLGVYDYGQMSYRLLMEYHKQFLHFWGIYVVLRFIAHYRDGRERERQAAALRLRTSELQNELVRAEIQALRSQLDPHFLFNTLNMISSVMYEDLGRADQMISTLSRMLRMSLEETTEARVPVRRELEFVQCAAELVRARFQEKVDILVDCAPEALDGLLPNLLLYTLVENSIKHHDFDLDPVIRVRAAVQRSGESLEVTVEDNGPGIADLGRAMTGGVGLSNTQKRLRALYGNGYRLEFQNCRPHGLRVKVTLPLESAPAVQAVTEPVRSKALPAAAKLAVPASGA